MDYLDKAKELIGQIKSGNKSSAEWILLQEMDLAELRQHEQQRNLTILLLKQWLLKDELKNWKKHRTDPDKKGKPVTDEEKRSGPKMWLHNMMMPPQRFCRVIFLLLFSVLLSAEESETIIGSGDSESDGTVAIDVEEDQSFVITGDMDVTDPRSVSSQITVITREEIEAVAPRNMADVLASVAGVQVQRYGGITEPATISIRGSSPEQVLVLIDGKRMNSAQGGGVDLSTIDTADIERIEITRGGGSAVHGENALAGVVNIITRNGYRQKPKISLRSSYGSLNTVELGSRFSGSTKDEILDGYMGASFRYTTGHYSYDDSNVESGIGIRENADGVMVDFGGEAGFKPWDNLRFSVSGHFRYDEKGVPGTLEFPTESARMEDIRGMGSVAASWNTEAGRFDVDVGVTPQFRHYSNPDGRPGAADDRHDNTSVAIETLWKRSDTLDWCIINSAMGYAFRHDALNSTALILKGIEGDGITNRSQHSAFVRPELHLLPFENHEGGRIGLFPALRYDWNTISFPADGINTVRDAFTWNVGILITPGPKRQFVVKGNLGTSYRVPSFNDMFWPSTAFAVGNPDLKPERALVWDVGVLAKPWSFLSIEAAWFHHQVTDLIQWNPGPGGQWRPINVGSARSYGVESEVKVLLELERIKSFVEIRANLTVMEARNLSAGAAKNKYLPRRPVLQSNAGVSLIHQDGHYGRIEGRYTGLRFVNAQNTKHYQHHFVLDLTLNAQFTEKWYALAALKNLLNLRYVDAREYPIPGIEIFVGTGVEF